MLGLNLGSCNAGAGADVQTLCWGWYLLAEGWGQPGAGTSHIPAAQSAKACPSEPCGALLQANPPVFFLLQTLHCMCKTSTPIERGSQHGKCARDQSVQGRRGEESFA